MSSGCSIDKCQRPSHVFCYSCKKNFCREHLREHDDLINSQLKPLVDVVKTISNRYKAVNTKKLMSEWRQGLDKWRDDGHNAIDRIYEQKRDDLNREWNQKLTKTQKDIDRIQSKLKEFSRKQKTTHEDIEQSTQAIRYIDQQLIVIEEKRMPIDIPTFIIDGNATPIKQTKTHGTHEFHLSPAYKTIYCSSQSGVALAANGQYLLVCENNYLKFFDSELILSKEILWANGFIYDICWSTALNHFIITTEKRTVYLFDQSSLSFALIQSIPQEKWWSSTCSDQTLFLSTYGIDPKIFQFSLQSSFELVGEWKSPDTCKQYQSIHDINYTNETLALVIVDSLNKATHFQLRSSTKLALIWSLTLDISLISYQPTTHCCLLKYDEWLVIPENTPNIFHTSYDGKLKTTFTYTPSAWNSLLLTSNILAVRTENNLFLHHV